MQLNPLHKVGKKSYAGKRHPWQAVIMLMYCCYLLKLLETIMAKNLNVFDKEYGLLINGEWTKPGALLDSYNPANGEVLAKFTDATDADVDAAVAAAQEAFKTWRKTTTTERAAILNKIADVIDENLELFALQETLDNGKPIRETPRRRHPAGFRPFPLLCQRDPRRRRHRHPA